MGGTEKRGMEQLVTESVAEANEALQAEELRLLATTSFDWQRFRPQIADQKTYDGLAAAVKEATARNESLAQLKGRIEALGENGVALARKVLEIARKA